MPASTPLEMKRDEAMKDEPSASRAAASDSESDSSESDSSESDSDDDSSDGDDDEAVRPGFVGRIANAVRAKQHRLLEARRHPVIEWRGAVRWETENAAGIALAQAKQRQREARVAAKAAKQERREKRRAQRRLNKLKDAEFRALVQRYDDELVKSEKRTEVLTTFSIDARAKEKQRIAATQLALQTEQARAAQQRIDELLRDDERAKARTTQDLQLVIETADEIARRCGVLPAINNPAPVPQDEQDETSSLLVLRINVPEESSPARSQSSTPLPAFQARGSSSRSSSSSSSGTSAGMAGTSDRRGSTRPALMRRTSMSPMAGVPLSAPSPAKRLFFTVNLKRFKHTEEIRGEAIGDHGGVELARSLLTGACPRVKRIDLGWNHIKYAGIVALADCFVRGACGQLQTLDLRCNSIDARSMQELLGALAKGALPELLDLVLQGNVIGDDGAKALAHAMLSGTLQALRSIDVRQNRIRNAGVQAIWNVFTSQCFKRYCPKLQLLDMRRNDASGALTRSFCPCPPYLAF